MKEGLRAEKCWCSLEAGKAKGTDLPLQPPVKSSRENAAPTPP